MHSGTDKGSNSSRSEHCKQSKSDGRIIRKELSSHSRREFGSALSTFVDRVARGFNYPSRAFVDVEPVKTKGGR